MYKMYELISKITLIKPIKTGSKTTRRGFNFGYSDCNANLDMLLLFSKNKLN